MTAWKTHRLPIVVPPLPGEALDSWLACYAARLRVSTPDFLTALGLPDSRTTRMVRVLTTEEEHALTTATGMDRTALVTMTLRPYDGLAVTISGEQERRLKRPPCWRRTGARSRYCPRCLESTPWRWPLEWRLPWVYACPHHRCLLLEACAACGNPPLAHGPSYRGPATPGLCSYPVPVDEPGARKLSRCRHRLADTQITAQLSTSGPILTAQQRLLELLRAGLSAPEPVGLALREIYALAWRALKGLGTVMDQAPNAVHDVVHDCGGTPPALTDRRMPERATQIAVGTAIAVIAHDPSHKASPEVFDWILEADRAQFTEAGNHHQQGHRIDRWRPAGERLTARVITSLNPTMTFHQRLRYGGAMPQPRWPALSADQARHRAAMIPALLWPSWTMRLLATDLTDQLLPHAFRAACSTILLVPGTRLAFTQAGELLGHNTPRRDRRMIDRFIQPSALTALASTLAQLAHALDAYGPPIDYARRRRILTLEALRIDRRAYEPLFRAHGWKPGPRRERHMRAYLVHLLGIATGDRFVDGSINHINEYRQFVLTLPAWLRSFLREQAQAKLAEHGISEPVTWEPPRHWVTDVTWPGVEPADVDRTRFHNTITARKTSARTAVDLGMTAEHVRLYADLSGLTAPERRFPQRAKGRLIPRTGDLSPERLRHLYLDQGLSYQRISERVGCSPGTIVNALAHAGVEPPPDRRAKITRAWLVEQCTVKNRALRGISHECGLFVSELRRVAVQWGIPAWTDFDRQLPAGLASLPQPLAPDLHRILVSENGLHRLQLILALPGMPSLAAAERALGTWGLSHRLSKIERALGFTIIERTRPLTATDRGQTFLARTELLLRSLSPPGEAGNGTTPSRSRCAEAQQQGKPD